MRLSSKLWPVSQGTVLAYKQMFYLADTPQRVDKIHQAICFG